MRILIGTDTYPPDINGVARSLQTLSEGLAKRGHVVEVITTVEGFSREPGLPQHVMSSMPVPGYDALRIGFASGRELSVLNEDTWIGYFCIFITKANQPNIW